MEKKSTNKVILPIYRDIPEDTFTYLHFDCIYTNDIFHLRLQPIAHKSQVTSKQKAFKNKNDEKKND